MATQLEPIPLDLTEEILELIRLASTKLPDDVKAALEAAHEREKEGSAAKKAFEAILENVKISQEDSTPVCQDTGTLIFDISYPFGYSTKSFDCVIKATELATDNGYLRPGPVDPISGKNRAVGHGVEFPMLHFNEVSDTDEIRVNLLLKGGGSENVSTQYKLPDSSLGAGRDMDGIKKMVLHAIYKAQGQGCAPGYIGVGVGGDRNTSFWVSKKQLFRGLQDKNPDPTLREAEEDLYEKANKLGIGPMGFGGETTVLGVKIGTADRLPASYFVSISYLCWAARRATLIWKDGEARYE